MVECRSEQSHQSTPAGTWVSALHLSMEHKMTLLGSERQKLTQLWNHLKTELLFGLWILFKKGSRELTCLQTFQSLYSLRAEIQRRGNQSGVYVNKVKPEEKYIYQFKMQVLIWNSVSSNHLSLPCSNSRPSDCPLQDFNVHEWPQLFLSTGWGTYLRYAVILLQQELFSTEACALERGNWSPWLGGKAQLKGNAKCLN